MLTISTASAGAGKTFLLTQTYIDMLFSAHQAKNAHRRILAVTFTKKATAEMKKRIVEELSKLARAEESDFAAGLQEKYTLTDNDLQKHAQGILYDLLQDYGAFAVSTIDSFFQQVIHAFSRELGLAGKYNLELDTKAIQQTAVDDFFFSLSPKYDKATFDGLLAIVEENLQQDQKWDPKNDILALSAELFKESLILNKDTLFEYLKNTSCIDAYKQRLYAIRQAYYETYEAARQPVKAYFETNGLEYGMFSYGKNVFAPLDYKQSDILAKLPLDNQPNSFIKFAEGESILKKPDKADVALQRHEDALRKLVQPLYACFRGMPACTYLTAHVILKRFSILTLLGKVSECIDGKNKELNRLAISDTNALLNDVVQANAESPFIYEKIGTRVHHFLIDEFQDTSAMQWTSFRPLIAESLATRQDNLVVGDVKQSIYRFRNSDYSLMLNGIRNDFPLSAQNPLGGNWRSARSVVNFNNALFGKLSAMLNAEMNEQLTSQYAAYQDVIQEVYHKHEQDPMLAIMAAEKGKTVEEGFVQVRFTPCEKKELWREEVLQQLPSLLADIKARGISLGRVACLVRNNKDALSIADTLIGAGYKVMSNEGLKLKASPAVMLVITYLKSLINPSDMIQQYALRYFAEQLGIDISTMWQLKAKGVVYSARNLFDHIQEIIQTLGLLESNHKSYVLALQDLVYDYQNKYYTADLYSFVTWWDEHADTKALSMQQTDDAIQLVSIHKSKGLEYDVVIIPFCDWAKAADINSYKNILWVKPMNASGDTTVPPLLPVVYNAILAQTAFAADYYKELLNLYLDNLNLTYVAFTRAKKELYVFAPELGESKSKKKGQEKTPSNIGELLHVLFPNNQLAMQQESNSCATIFRMGVQDVYTQKEQQNEADEKEQWKLSLPLLPNIPMNKPKAEATTADKQDKETEGVPQEQHRFAIRFSSQDFFGDEEDGTAFGTLMHQILQQVYVRGDEDKVIAEMLRMGMLQQSALPAVKTSMEQFWTLIDKKGKEGWYDPNRYTILNEQEILLRTGMIKRADRILVDKEATNQAIVIDYKFGEERKKYYQQVREYMGYLRDMGYSVKGYLCYVTQEEIKDVTAF